MTTRKTRKQATTLHRKPGGGSGWFAGLLIGVLIGGCVVFYLLAVNPNNLLSLSTATTPATENKKEATAGDAAEKKKPSGPRFDFYKLLPENSKTTNAGKPNTTPTSKPTLSAFDSDDDIADTSTTVSASGVPVETHTATTDSKLPGSYLLQAGSFRSNSDADKARVNIILLGLPARVESVKNDKGETFYRVYVGSFSTAADMQKAQDTLKANKITSVVIKSK